MESGSEERNLREFHGSRHCGNCSVANNSLGEFTRHLALRSDASLLLLLCLFLSQIVDKNSFSMVFFFAIFPFLKRNGIE